MSQPPHNLTHNGLEVPPDFPLAAYEAVYSGSRPHSTEAADAALRTAFGTAWNAVAYRFLSAAYYSDSFKESAARDGIATTPTVRYEEERALFGFFTNAISSIDAAYYGLYVIGTLLSPLHFWLILAKRQRLVSLASTCHAYAGAFPDDPIASALDAVQTDGAFICLRRIRNILTHHAALRRQYVLHRPTEWFPGIPLTPDMLTPLRVGVARLLIQTLEAAAIFVSGRHF